MNREIITIENGIVSVPASGKIWMTEYYPKQIVIQSTVFLDVENQEDMIFTL